jgi:hypothetical protein
MKDMKGNLKKGITVKVKPSVAIKTEFMRNGWSQEKLDMKLNPSRYENNEDDYNSLIDYVNGKGYFFDWGHVLEVIDDTVWKDGTKHIHSYSAQWQFSLDDILSLAHRHGWVLEDLCRACEKWLYQMNIEIPISMEDFSTTSCFSFHVYETDKKQFKLEAKKARRWLAKVFITEHVPVLIDLLTKELSSNVPGQETKLQ